MDKDPFLEINGSPSLLFTLEDKFRFLYLAVNMQVIYLCTGWSKEKFIKWSRGKVSEKF